MCECHHICVFKGSFNTPSVLDTHICVFKGCRVLWGMAGNETPQPHPMCHLTAGASPASGLGRPGPVAPLWAARAPPHPRWPSPSGARRSDGPSPSHLHAISGTQQLPSASDTQLAPPWAPISSSFGGGVSHVSLWYSLLSSRK